MVDKNLKTSVIENMEGMSLSENILKNLDEFYLKNKAKRSKLEKKIKAGDDVGKPGKNFDNIARKAAAEHGGNMEIGKKIAAAAMWKHAKETVELTTNTPKHSSNGYKHKVVSDSTRKNKNVVKEDVELEESKLSDSQRKTLDAIKKEPFTHEYSKAPNPKSGFHIKTLNSLSNMGYIKKDVKDGKTATWSHTGKEEG